MKLYKFKLNKFMNKFYSLLIISLIAAVSIVGCSKEKNNLVVAPEGGIHAAGYADPSSPDFHGKGIAAHNWSMDYCKQCHGNDFKGGNGAKSCYDCHPSGPTSCTLCHGNGKNTIYPPKALNGSTDPTYLGVGAHDVHLSKDTTLRNSAGVRCVACHWKIPSFTDTMHISPTRNGVAIIVFDSLAILSRNGVTPHPVWDRATATCSGTYCHGNFRNGNYVLHVGSDPSWTSNTPMNCGSCHGNPETGDPLPGGTHFTGFTQDQCYYCHGNVMDASGQIINKSLHINGVIDRLQKK
jgi:predicted CxxxxCH...CXXCH cytochrome family protein